MALTEEMTQDKAAWLAERRKGIGGSDANILMSGDDAAILDLWLEKTGQRESDDLSWVLPVQMGIATEALNIAWLAHVTGWDIETGLAAIVNPEYPFARCNLDGRTRTHVIEAKHVNAFASMDEVAQKYMPQLHHNMFCDGKTKSALTVFKGTMEHHWFEIALDEWYLADLLERERKFWDCVQTRTPPAHMPAIVAPVPPEKWRSVSMQGNNAWAQWAADWIENQKPAKRFKEAEKEIKALVEADVGEAKGHGIVVKRSKANALSIKDAR